MTPNARLAAALALAALGSACASSAPRAPGGDGVRALIRQGSFEQAVVEAERRHRERPGDAAALEDYRYASTALLLERGRRALFERRVEEALDHFQEARAISPEPRVADAWIENARRQLAMYWHDQGLLAQVGEDLEQARENFERALAYDPEYGRARAALIRVLLQINYRAGMSEEYYDQGVRAFGDLRLDEAHQYFSYSRTYDPENQRAFERRAEARTQLAARRVFLAEQMEAERKYAAAYNEYRIALLLDPELEAAVAGAERLKRERDAAELLREADRGIMRRDYAAAVAAVEAARALTHVQQPECDSMAANIEEARLTDQYEAARTLESDQQYERAVAVYAALLEKAPFFRDAITRRDTLQSYIAQAEDLYAKAMAAGSDSERARYLRRIETFWPEYRDVREQLAAFGD